MNMLTINQLLKNKLFKEAQVVAGSAGLANTVTWSHIIDVPTVAGMVEPQNLIITTGQGIPADSNGQAMFVQDLIQANTAGLVISIGGDVFQEVPRAMITVGDQHAFPIIAIPTAIRFVDITRAIHEQSVSHQYALLKQSDYIHQTLTQIVLEGGGLQKLAEALARLVNRSVTIENPELNRLLAYAMHGEVDSARQESIEAGKTPAFIREFVQESGILEEARQRLQPVVAPVSPEHGMTKERILAPIVVGREIYGYVWLIAGDEALDESDRRAIERAATVAALIMLNTRAVRQTEARHQADLISQLLSGQTEALMLQDKANRLGLDLLQPLRVMLLKPADNVAPTLRQADELSNTVTQAAEDYMIQPLGPYYILILPETVNAQDLGRRLVDASPGMKVAIGRVAAALEQLPQSYKEASEAMEIGLSLTSDEYLYDFDHLGFLPWLYHLPDQARALNPYIQRITALATNERAKRADLLRTLEVLLDCGNNASETARVLGIHRNTLTYRLKQIETLCGVSLANSDVRLNLQIAIKALYLNNYES